MALLLRIPRCGSHALSVLESVAILDLRADRCDCTAYSIIEPALIACFRQIEVLGVHRTGGRGGGVGKRDKFQR